MSTERKRMELRLNESMYEWYKDMAEEIGIPMHSLIVMALLQYQKTETVLPNLPDMVKAMVDFNVATMEREREVTNRKNGGLIE